jgi:hypothetical protein
MSELNWFINLRRSVFHVFTEGACRTGAYVLCS